MALCYPKGISAEGEISELHVGLKGTIGDEPVEIEEEVPAKENEPLERIEKNNNSDAPVFEEWRHSDCFRLAVVGERRLGRR
jgi:hypothetical protein